MNTKQKLVITLVLTHLLVFSTATSLMRQWWLVLVINLVALAINIRTAAAILNKLQDPNANLRPTQQTTEESSI